MHRGFKNGGKEKFGNSWFDGLLIWGGIPEDTCSGYERLELHTPALFKIDGERMTVV